MTCHLILLATAVLSIGGCEAIFSGPTHENAGGESTGATSIDTEGDQKLTTGMAPDPPDDAGTESEIDGGIAFDLGNESGGDPPPPRNEGECCTAAKGIGCADAAVAACVCAVDPACCESGWDELCAKHVEQLGCGVCVGTSGTRDAVQDCCVAHDEPGCADMGVAECVCASDSFCCMVGWDQVCVDLVLALGCDDCIDPLGPVDIGCCVEHEGGGCDDPEIAACVCEQDAYCCDTAWDGVCVSQVDSLGCGDCYGEGTTSVDTDPTVTTSGGT